MIADHLRAAASKILDYPLSSGFDRNDVAQATVDWLEETAAYLDTANRLGSTADHDAITSRARVLADCVLGGAA